MFILFYKTVDNYVEKRKPYRDAHLAYAQEAHKRGELVLAGAFANPADDAVLIFKGENSSAAETFAKNDPYVKNGLIEEWKIREWTVVIGS